MSKVPMLDMFKRVLPAIDLGQKQFYETLTDEEKKGFSPWLVQRYLSSAESADNRIIERYLIMTNELVNKNGIKDHELTWKLMTIVGCGKSVKHPYVAPSKGKKRKSNAFKQWYSDQHPELNDQELEILLSKIDKTTALDILTQYHVKDKRIIEAANEL